MSTTKYEELPLHYRHPTLEGTLILSFAIDDKEEIIKGYYFWAVQDDVGQAKDYQVVKGLTRLNEIRNEFIMEGWKRWLPPKVSIAGNNRQDRREKEKIQAKTKKAEAQLAKKTELRNLKKEDAKAALAKLTVTD